MSEAPECREANFLLDYQFGTTEVIALCIVNIPAAVTAIVANFLVILSICRTPSLHTPSNVFICGLALADFFVGLVTQPLIVATGILSLKGTTGTHEYCSVKIARIIAAFCMGGIIVATLTATSLDRYIVIRLHLRYQEIVTNKRAVAVLAGIWFVIFFACSLSLLWSNMLVILYLTKCNVALNFIVTGITYVLIYRVIRRHKAQIQAQFQVQRQARNPTNLLQLKKSSFSMFIVSCIFALFCLPIVIAEFMIQITGQRFADLRYPLQVSLILLFVNSTINPVLICWRFKRIRLAVIETTKLIFRIKARE